MAQINQNADIQVLNLDLFLDLDLYLDLDLDDEDVVDYIVNTNNLIMAFYEAEVNPKREQVHEYNRDRAQTGEHARMFLSLRQFPKMFQGYYRLTVEEFDDVLEQLHPIISSKVELGTAPGRNDYITAEEKLAMTLAWDYPHCIGAIDGKHIALHCPDKTASQFFFYKGFFSLVLLAVADSNYKFIYIDVGEYGKSSDGGTFSTSKLGQGLKSHSISLPAPEPIVGSETNENFPYAVVGDEAFPLLSYLLRPYSGAGFPLAQKVFNYRLSRARHVIENAFGIMVCRFPVLKNKLELQPESATEVVYACCLLHNYILSKRAVTTNEVDTVDNDGSINRTGAWRGEPGNPNPRANTHLGQLPGLRSRRIYGSAEVRDIRNSFCNYFNTNENGMLDYQNDRANTIR